ncbi:hypothetical protein KKB99_02525, partial [bacterium]|nr:hypothetical protein [bacterium]MBU1024862.1 hypothetical protein [bacterium]
MTRTYLLMFTFVLIFAGCSGGSSDPIAGVKTPGSIDNIPIIDLSQAGGVTQATGLLGAYEITINPENMTAELVSKRMGAIGDSYIVSGAAFFTILPCADCLRIVGVGLDADGNGWLKFEISHPFAPGNPGLPPSASNRNDLDVFDLAMVIHPSGVTPQTFTKTGKSAYSTSCVGAAGYTTELSNFLSVTAAMPYFLCVDDSIDASPIVSTWNKFAMGATTTFEAGFNLSGPLSFDTYLTMGYGHSALKPDRLTPKYYNPEFNRKAAWKVEVTPPEGANPPAMGNTWNDTDTTTPFDVEVTVFDWQYGATVSTEPDFGDAATNEIFAASDPASVSVEIPGMNSTLPQSITPVSGTGTPDDPLIYTVSFPNQNGLAVGEYIGLVKVTDERAP